ncbi:hypothetical protein JKF63_06246 [Porcisia hertigi]|uniref:Uncharacterized protein n=1 Tax=Porcisia hertigi TaxID=2761500 RepID=A0A836LES0_9TRYP|nr:hypothetical protein JKF63_06246 [Porcisia hertigi]
MEKVVLTTYRKLHKMCHRVDSSVAMRTQLMCCPLQVYDHRMMEWQSFDISEMKWAEPRTFLDALIRRLNNGSPQYIPPLPQEATKAVEGYKLQCASMFTAAEGHTHSVTSGKDAKSSASVEESAGGGEVHNAPSSSSESLGGARGSTVPLCVLPYSALTVALRQIYESTPFSMNNLANAFAAVKELQYVCDLDSAGKGKRVTLSAASAAEATDLPQLQRALEVMPLHNSLIQGLGTDQRVSLDRHARRAKKSSPSREDNAAPATTAAVTASAVAPFPKAHRSPESVFAVVEDVEGEASFTGEDKVDSVTEEEGGKAKPTSPPEESKKLFDAGLSDILPGKAEMAEEPKEVQLLLSHPTARGFFRRTVLLMVRHVAHESAALVLNKPLRNEEGLEMSIESTIRLGRVHPIFRRHLAQHTLMIGGPVMSGSTFDESIFLLHRVPGVPHALPLGSNLWLDGDLDVLLAKLDAREVSAEEDIVVLCGFAGWGFDQLKGELGNGYWVVASGPSANASVGKFVMSLAHTAVGRHPSSQGHQVPNMGAAAPSCWVREKAAGESTDATSASPASGSAEQQHTAVPVSEEAKPLEESIRAEAQHAADTAASKAIPSLKRRRRQSSDIGKMQSGYIETLSWVRAYASVGQPYADMATNQRAFAEDDDHQE